MLFFLYIDDFILTGSTLEALNHGWCFSNLVFLFFVLRSQRASSSKLFGSTQMLPVAMAI